MLLKILAFTLRVAVTYEVVLLIDEFPLNFGSINNAEHCNNKKSINVVFYSKANVDYFDFCRTKKFLLNFQFDRQTKITVL